MRAAARGSGPQVWAVEQVAREGARKARAHLLSFLGLDEVALSAWSPGKAGEVAGAAVPEPLPTSAATDCSRGRTV